MNPYPMQTIKQSNHPTQNGRESQPNIHHVIVQSITKIIKYYWQSISKFQCDYPTEKVDLFQHLLPYFNCFYHPKTITRFFEITYYRTLRIINPQPQCYSDHQYFFFENLLVNYGTMTEISKYF